MHFKHRHTNKHMVIMFSKNICGLKQTNKQNFKKILMVRKKTIEVSFLANIFIIKNFVRETVKLRRLKDKKS